VHIQRLNLLAYIWSVFLDIVPRSSRGLITIPRMSDDGYKTDSDRQPADLDGDFIQTFKEENGHLYHSFGDDRYPVPKGEADQQLERRVHGALNGFGAYFAPIGLDKTTLDLVGPLSQHEFPTTDSVLGEVSEDLSVAKCISGFGRRIDFHPCK
jgi:hypothetical protein